MPTRIAVVGAGPLVGQAHCKILKDLSEDAELACICQRRADDTELSEVLGVPLYTDAEEMAYRERLDGVVIAAPTHVHLAVAKACIAGWKRRQADLVESGESGLKALLIEKPICQDLASAVELLNVSEAACVDVLVGHQRRHSAFVKRAQELVTDRNFGPLRGVTMEFSLLKPESYFCKDNPAIEWRRRKGVGGPLLINSIHDLDLMRYITGHEITQVFAMTSSGARGNEVEDSGAVTLTFDHGAVGTLFFTDAAPAPWSYEFTTGENKKYPPVPENHTRDCYHFMGAQRSLGFPSLRSFAYSPELHQKEAGWDCPLTFGHEKVELQDPLRVQMAHFVQVCRGDEKPVCSGRDAVQSLAVVMAVLRSAETGRSVAPCEMLAEVNKAFNSAEGADLGVSPLADVPAGHLKRSSERLSGKATSVPGTKHLDTTVFSDEGYLSECPK